VVRVRRRATRAGGQRHNGRATDYACRNPRIRRLSASTAGPVWVALIVISGLWVALIVISGRAADISDLTEPSEAVRRRADGSGHARRAEPVQ
jgi:hypothetical protein